MPAIRAIVVAAMLLGTLASSGRAGVAPLTIASQQPEVEFDSKLTGVSITGATNHSDLRVLFSSPTDILYAPSNEQARHVPVFDGLVNYFTVAVPGAATGDLILNLLKDNDSTTLTAMAKEPSTGALTASFYNDVGQKFMTITTAGGANLAFSSAGSFEPRISGVTSLSGAAGSAETAPEPASLSLLAIAGIVTGGYALRRRQRQR